ncbi:MAG: neocarzinostatin apoprotein domain-containing protein [Actinomycetota bacterium]
MATDQVLEIDFDAPEPGRRWATRLAVVVGSVALFAAAFAIARAGDPDEPSPDAFEDDTDDVTAGEVVVEIQSAGRADGLDSLRMPMVASPNDGLIDEQEVALSASGFQAGVGVAAVQCAAIPGSLGGENNCDVGNYTLHSSDDDGAIAFSVTVRRYISTASGEVDCANPGQFQCVIAVANISDYDESATADVWFDPTVDGVRGPVIDVANTDGLADGSAVSVVGSGFPADAPVIVGQCIIGGSSSIFGCWDETARLADVVADADGAFAVEVEVERVTFDNQDCFGSLYGCRIAARTDLEPFALGDGTATNPVRIWFDGTTAPTDLEWGIAYAMNPDRDLADGEVVNLALANLTTFDCVEEELIGENGERIVYAGNCEEVPIQEGTVLAMQCGDLALGEEYCTDAVEIDISDGTARGEVSVQRFFLRDSGEQVDCAEPGRICELRLTGDIAGHVPLRFAGDG